MSTLLSLLGGMLLVAMLAACSGSDTTASYLAVGRAQ